MGYYSRYAFRLFNPFSETLAYYLSDLRLELKKARLKISVQEYLSTALLSSFLFFLISLPVLSLLFAVFLQEFLFAFITSFTVSIVLSVATFTVFLNYPRVVMSARAKELDNNLPFAALYLSTVAGAKLPLHKTFEIFAKFSGYGEVAKETGEIVNDVKSFGLDINTALERQIERTPSKNFAELLWGILSAIRAGGNLSRYLNEKSSSFMAEYRRKIYEFSHTLTLYVELYLTSIVLGSIFFTILTSIIAGIGGTQGDIILLQFFLIFMFLPLVSIAFIFLIRASTPGGE